MLRRHIVAQLACASSRSAHRGIAGRTSLQPRARATSLRTGFVPARGHRPVCAWRSAWQGFSLELRLVPLAVPLGDVDVSRPLPSFKGCRCSCTHGEGVRACSLGWFPFVFELSGRSPLCKDLTDLAFSYGIHSERGNAAGVLFGQVRQRESGASPKVAARMAHSIERPSDGECSWRSR